MRGIIPYGGRILGLAAILAGLGAAPALAEAAPNVADLGQLSLEDLANVEITSVSKHAEPLSQAAAAIYVITREDIRRSGAVSLPEALRLAPNLEVAQDLSGSYGITARGFNSTTASDKLLVLIDGRSVYSPLHSGVFWDAQTVMLADVERIEVISGPGGTLWGANAVNGVINIITRKAADTQGALVEGGGGDRDNTLSLRYGGRLGAQTSWRAYATGFQREGVFSSPGVGLGDDWEGAQGGFRIDGRAAQGAYTLQGDYYQNHGDFASRGSGGNLLGRWTRQLGDGSNLEVQAYYDATRRTSPVLLDSSDTYDLHVQQDFAVGQRQTIVWGGGYRLIKDEFSSIGFGFAEPRRSKGVGDLFVQDEVTLRDDLDLKFGIRVEHSNFYGWQYMPSARLAWRVNERNLLWGGISRGVRTPSRIDQELQFPPLLIGAPDFEAETLVAYELGYRGRPFERLSISISAYYNDYDKLRTTETTPVTVFPIQIQNGYEGVIYGIEAWGDLQVFDWWRLSAGVNGLHKDFHFKPGHSDINHDEVLGNDPDYQASLRSRMSLGERVDLDLAVRRQGDLTTHPLPGYTEADARIAWRVWKTLELSLTGSNLLHAYHTEYRDSTTTGGLIPRSVYAGLRWDF